MARLPRRTFSEHVCHHLIVRGNGKRKVFLEEADYQIYLKMLAKAKRKYGISIYAYCLMPNHVHLLIKCLTIVNMASFMKWLNGGYSRYFNAKYEKVGHLWQSRYISKPVINGIYLLHCAQYIEANPMRAKIVDDFMEYEWSSYRSRCLSQQNLLLDEIDLLGDKAMGTDVNSEVGTLLT